MRVGFALGALTRVKQLPICPQAGDRLEQTKQPFD
jgi:hypothetical protein